MQSLTTVHTEHYIKNCFRSSHYSTLTYPMLERWVVGWVPNLQLSTEVGTTMGFALM